MRVERTAGTLRRSDIIQQYDTDFHADAIYTDYVHFIEQCPSSKS